jgi:putative ABC transport system permease protein
MTPQPLGVRVFALAVRWLGGDALRGHETETITTFAEWYARAAARGPASRIAVLARALADLALARVRSSRPGGAWSADLRFAWRRVVSRPMASLVIVASMGAAMAGTTAAFSVFNAVMLRAWGEDDSRVVRLREDYAAPGQAPDVRGFTLGRLPEWRAATGVFDGIAAGSGSSVTLTGAGSARRLNAGRVTANFFEVLGFQPVIGRVFTPEEETPGADDVTILTYGLWQSAFGGDRGVVGRSLELDGRPYRVVGVMPKGLRHPYQSDLWLPLTDRDPAKTRGVYAPARLRAGVLPYQAARELNALVRRLYEADPGPNTPTGAQVTPLRAEMIGPLDRVLWGLLAAAALVLVIATANVANLLLAQGLERSGETAVCIALGASRGRVVRQSLAHGALLAAAGAGLGCALTFWSVGPLVALSPLYGAGEFDITPRLDVPTLLFTAGVTLMAALVSGGVPAWRALSTGAANALHEAGRSGMLARGSRRWLRGLVAAELALALLLLAATAVVVSDLRQLGRTEWGVNRGAVTVAEVSLPARRYATRADRVLAIREMTAAIRRAPGVGSAAAASLAPFDPGTAAAAYNIDGAAPSGRDYRLAHVRSVTDGYFESLGIPVRAGRAIDSRDIDAERPVVVVSESMAAALWPGESALGRRVKTGRIDGPGPWLEVVGVVGDVREGPDAEIPGGHTWYVPMSGPQIGGLFDVSILVRGTASPAGLAAAIATVSPDIAVDVTPLDARFRRLTGTDRLLAMLTAALAALGVVLAATGVYAVLAASIARRHVEFGVRTALGARPVDLGAGLMGEGARLVAIAWPVGAALFAWAWRSLGETHDASPWLSLSVATGILVAMAMVSAAVPARRASRIDPIKALRGE